MMNIGPSDARALTLYEYQALLYNWEQAHATDEPAPDEDAVAGMFERMRAKGMVH